MLPRNNAPLVFISLLFSDALSLETWLLAAYDERLISTDYDRLASKFDLLFSLD